MAKKSFCSKSLPSIDLRALEEEVLAEGREWMQRRMEDKLREKREAFSPEGGAVAPSGTAQEADAQNHVRRHHAAGGIW